MTAAPPPLSPSLAAFARSSANGALAPETTELAPGIFLHADPGLGLAGQWRSPPGRFLELEATAASRGDWAALHLALPLTALQDLTYLGYVCRAAGPSPWMIRPCLRSGREDGSFVDTFFGKHILTTNRPFTHMDALHLDSCPDLPLTAPWRELVLFLPCEDFQIYLHHIYPFAL